MAEISINGVRRTEFGKGASRRARRDGLVPAVIYGHGEKPQHITLPARELGVALKQSNVLLDISIDGSIDSFVHSFKKIYAAIVVFMTGPFLHICLHFLFDLKIESSFALFIVDS